MIVDEKTRRKVRFNEVDSCAVVLADDQTWYLPKPWLTIQPIFKNGTAEKCKSFLSYDRNLDEQITAITKCNDDETIIALVASIGACMLSINYDLSDEELNNLFRYRVADQRGEDWTVQVMDIATGQSGPKALSGGDD